MREFMEIQEELVCQLHSDAEQGLTNEQVEKNRLQYGANILTREKPPSFLKRVVDAAKEPMILMLLAAGVITLIVNVIRAATGGETDFFECVGVFAAIFLSVIITVVMEGKGAKAFEALSKINENTVIKTIRNHETILLNQKELVVGDIILLETGDKIPADGRLLSAMRLMADESALTGESASVKKMAHIDIMDEKTPLAERFNMVYSGNYIIDGSGKMIVTAVGDQAEFGKIAKELTAIDHSTTPLQEKLARLGKMITIFGVIAAAIVFIAQLISFITQGILTLDNIMNAFITSIVLIVAAVPEGLPTIVAVSLSINIIKLAKQNALVKKMIASETVGCTNVICSDKTGTLTENKMTVTGYYDGSWHDNPRDLTSQWMIHNICLNTSADISEKGDFLGNPTECAALRFYEQSEEKMKSGKSYIDERIDHETVQVFPFSSELKHMTTISKVDGQVISYVKGSPERVFEMCDISSEEMENIQSKMQEVQKQAMRVIAFAHREIDEWMDFETEENHCQLESHMVFDGFIAISDPLRPDVYEAVQQCRSAGVMVKILTGDNILTATAIANQLHLLDGGLSVVEAREIADLEDEALLELLPNIGVIARSTPTIKMRVVKLLKQQGNVVAVTGDGINDAPALKNADVGIAMGISGTDVSKEASDIVLLNDSFSTIVKAIQWGRGIYQNFQRFIQFQLTVNVSSVIVVLVSILMGLPAPFTALQLLWINIIMDGPPALTLGLEPVYEDLMKQPPTRRNDNIISKEMMIRILASGVYISCIFLLQYRLNFLGATEAQAPTVLFALFALFQLFNSFNCRELHQTSIFKSLFKNHIMLLVIGITFILQVLIIQFAGAFFGTVPLPLVMWVKLFIISCSIVILSELIKAIYRYKSKY